MGIIIDVDGKECVDGRTRYLYNGQGEKDKFEISLSQRCFYAVIL
jgi:hypothetical protein